MGLKGGGFTGPGFFGFLSEHFSRAANGINQHYHAAFAKVSSLTQKFSAAAGNWCRDISREAMLLEEGLAHIGDADAQTQGAFRRDAVTCAVETGLSIAEGVELEAAVAIAALEAGEKIVNSPPGKVSLGETAIGMAAGLASSAVALMSAGASAIHDLEASGMEWESRHGKAAKLPAPRA